MIPERMRASVMDRPMSVSIQDRPTPAPGPGDVLVQVRAVGVCGSDVHWYTEGRIGSTVVAAPLVLGHEASGHVVALGEGVTGDLMGQRVSIEPGVPCRRCQQCHRGRYNLCPNMRFMATPPIDGAFAEYVVMPADFVYPVPDSVSDDAAALLEPLSVGIWSNQQGGVGPGSRVLITGAGPIGLVALQVARAFGAGEVLVSDISPERLAVAEGFGGTPVDARTADLSDAAVDTVLECSGAPAAIAAGFRAAGPSARVVLVGMGPAEVPVPLEVIQQRELVVTGTFRYANTWPLALDLVARGAVDLDALVTGHFGLAQAVDALDAGRDPRQIKAIVNPAD